MCHPSLSWLYCLITENEVPVDLVIDFPGVPSMIRRCLQRVYPALHPNVHGYQTPGTQQGGLQQSGVPPVVDSCSVPLVVANNEGCCWRVSASTWYSRHTLCLWHLSLGLAIGVFLRVLRFSTPCLFPQYDITINNQNRLWCHTVSLLPRPPAISSSSALSVGTVYHSCHVS